MGCGRAGPPGPGGEPQVEAAGAGARAGRTSGGLLCSLTVLCSPVAVGAVGPRPAGRGRAAFLPPLLAGAGPALLPGPGWSRPRPAPVSVPLRRCQRIWCLTRSLPRREGARSSSSAVKADFSGAAGGIFFRPSFAALLSQR